MTVNQRSVEYAESGAMPTASLQSNAKGLALASLELFTGAGGLALGTHEAGFRHVGLLEWPADACKKLLTNARQQALPGIEGWRVLQEDARRVVYGKFGAVELIAGGPPCQPFSIGGRHRGVDDGRNMIPEFTRAVRELQPRAFIMENVRGLTRATFRTYFSYVVLQLTYPTITRTEQESWLEHLERLESIHTSSNFSNLRYNVVYRVLNAADYGVSQTRERVFLVGFRADTGIEWHFPEPTHSLLSLLQDQWGTGAYWKRHGLQAPNARPAGYSSPTVPATLPGISPTLPWRTVRDAISGLPKPCGDRESESVLNHRLIPGARSYTGHTGSPLDLPAKTLKAGDHGVPGGENMLTDWDGSVRYFTVREAARLQTFPDTWELRGSWSEAMRQLGNAVPVELAHVVAASVARALSGTDG